jgi:hypothetical protein
MFVFGVVAIEVWNTDFPVWGFVLALMICMFCLTFVLSFLPEFNIRCVFQRSCILSLLV